MSKEKRIAQEILTRVGGINNINSIIHCMTRVRLDIRHENKVNMEGLKQIEGVLGVVQDERLQIIVGPGTVNKVAQEMAKTSGVKLGEPIPHHDQSTLEANTKAKYRTPLMLLHVLLK